VTGPASFRFSSPFSSGALFLPRQILPNSFFLYNLPLTPLFAARCTRNDAYLDENKDLRGWGEGTSESPLSHNGNALSSIQPNHVFSWSSMRTLIATGLLCIVVSSSWGQQIPAGTLLPVMLDDTIESDKSKPGDEISAKLRQQLALPDRLKIKKGSKLLGHVVSITPPADGKNASVIVQFDHIQIGKKSIPISTGMRAYASMQLVAQARNPVNTNAGAGTSVWDLNVSQIGGQIAYNGAKIVKAPNGQVVGRVVEPGAIVGVPLANPARGCPTGGAGEQAFWLFSTDACGIYDNSNINLSSSGIGGPKPGQITFQFDKAFSLRGGSAWLLQVN